MYPVRILPGGDAALLVDLPQAIDPDVNVWCVSFASAVVDRFGTAVRDAVVGYCSVTVYFDPVHVDPAWLERELLEAAAEMPAVSVPEGASASLDVPLGYGGT